MDLKINRIGLFLFRNYNNIDVNQCAEDPPWPSVYDTWLSRESCGFDSLLGRHDSRLDWSLYKCAA